LAISSGSHFLVQVAAGALAQQRRRVVRLGKAAEDEHRQLREAGLDGGECIDPALVGHGDVQQQHVDLAAACHLQRLVAAAAFAGDAQVDMVGQELAQSGAHDGVVVDDTDADHGLASVLARLAA
jgi:hypothetical protein